MSEETHRSIDLEGVPLVDLFGEKDRNLRAIEGHFGVRVTARNGRITVRGDPEAVERVCSLLEHLGSRVRAGATLTEEDIHYALSQMNEAGGPVSTWREPEVVLRADRGLVKVRTAGQARYVDAMRRSDVVFAIGPAGTGKTYLAVAMAVRCLKEKLVDRIVLARPAVEAGESLGFLPGDLQEKVDPYLRPLYDALREMLSFEKIQRFLQLGVIEVVPLAFMRGRTLARAFVILDEAQNSTLPQMKMFLTRLGPRSRAVVTGDITQIDLPSSGDSGLVQVQSILKEIPGIEFVYLHGSDVVRHRLVKDIIEAFERGSDGEGDSR